MPDARADDIARPRPWWGAAAVAACTLLAAASLIVSRTPSFDAWGWSLWGRELAGGGTFSTAQYPSWKPLPALADTVFALVSRVAEPALWLVVARAGGLLALVLVARLAWRYGGVAAGAVAAVALAVAPGWWMLLSAGSSEPLLAALALGAIDRHLAARRGQALALGVAAALLRPETWPFLLVYAAWNARRADALERAATVTGLAAVPVLWFGGDWLGSGSPWTGGRLARVAVEAQQLGSGTLRPHAAAVAVGNGFGLVVAPVLASVAVAVLVGGRRRTMRLAVAAALAQIAIVAAEAAVGYAGLGRFALPAGAVLCAVGAVGAVTAARALAAVAERRRLALAVGAALVAVAATAAVPRVVASGRDLGTVAATARLAADTRAALGVLRASGALATCDHRVAATSPYQPALAVAFGAPVTAVNRFSRARIVLGSPRTAQWAYVVRWLRRHPRRRRLRGAGALRRIAVFAACGRPARGRPD